MTAVACGGGGGRPATTPAPAGGTAGGTGGGPAAGGPAAVAIELYAFNPATVQVAVGQEVTWTEKDDDIGGKGAHNVVADDKSFSSELIKKGETFSFTPKKAGSITYFCGVHNYMKGTITVS